MKCSCIARDHVEKANATDADGFGAAESRNGLYANTCHSLLSCHPNG